MAPDFAAGRTTPRGFGRTGGLLATVLAVAVTVATPPAHAQINPFRGYKGPTLSRDDLAAAQNAALALLNDDPATVGQSESWTGPASGNQGTLTITKVFDRTGMPCRLLTSAVVYKKTKGRQSYSLTVCRIASGGWKLAE